MKRKLKLTSCFIIIASLFILAYQLYSYSTHVETLKHLDSFNPSELDKEIFISIVMLVIGSIMFLRSTKLKEES
ncbi:hypothetical protein LNQ81_11900 [Myroides sp. M-43]|uniref:hypothetical protein n=1 Tax=Myroides oncorhynchi TaxID=2893756 RepID=UPI001E5F8BD5|nr:hypothetical protein [Myroides oncorhynchi]MCC9043372.1 hypothetical protein [Myroides oncorhynchi]